MNQTAKVGQTKELKIRRARTSDAPQLAALTGQLGYPATVAQIRKRLQGIKPASQNAVFVAHSKNDGVIGWLHVSRDVLLESEIRAEVNGLVVAEGQRSLGAGARLEPGAVVISIGRQTGRSMLRPYKCSRIRKPGMNIRKCPVATYIALRYTE